MNSLQPPDRRRFALRTAAFLLLAVAGVGMAMGGDNFTIRSLALVACLAGVACVRRINVRALPASAATASQRVELQPSNKRKFALLTVAFLLLAFAGVTMAMGGSTVMAMLAVSTSVVCVRLINVHTPSGSATNLATLITRPIGIISIGLVPIMATASFFLYRDAIQGYHQFWPLHFFAATAFICALCWSYLFSMLISL